MFSPRREICALAGAVLEGQGGITYSRQIPHPALRTDPIAPVVADILLDGFLLFDAHGAIEFANSATEAIFHHRPDSLIGRYIHEVIPELSRQTTSAASDEVRPHMGRTAHRSGQMVGRRGDGSDVPLQVSIGAPMIEGVRKFVCCVRDLSQHGESPPAAEALREQTVQARKRNELSTIVVGIAHDLTNALLPVVSLTELNAAKLPRGSPEAGDLAKALTAANYARDLVRQLCLLARPGGMGKQIVRLDEIVAGVSAYLRAVLATRVRIEERIAADTDPILADPNEIRQVLVNLGLNASDGMAESGGVLKIELSQVDIADELRAAQGKLVPGRYLCMSVSDTGRGTDARHIDRVFEPFFTTKTVGQGTGLGLSVVASIVQNHDGAITLQSQLNQGSVFKVFLPVSADV